MKALSDAMLKHGLLLNFVPPTGVFVRVNKDGSRDTTNSAPVWVKLFDDGKGAAFGDHSSDLSSSVQFTGSAAPALTETNQTHVSLQRARDADRERTHRNAYGIWANATAEPHSYLETKGISPNWSRVTTNGDLVIRYCTPNSDRLLLQLIKRTSNGFFKRFLKGSSVSGCFGTIGHRHAHQVVICEGFATAASLHEHFGHPYVVYAGFSGNLLPVAEAIRANNPSLKITIAADDDWMRETNVGLVKAQEAADAIGGSVITPEWPSNRPDWATDFNDLHLLRREVSHA